MKIHRNIFPVVHAISHSISSIWLMYINKRNIKCIQVEWSRGWWLVNLSRDTVTPHERQVNCMLFYVVQETKGCDDCFSYRFWGNHRIGQIFLKWDLAWFHQHLLHGLSPVKDITWLSVNVCHLDKYGLWKSHDMFLSCRILWWSGMMKSNICFNMHHLIQQNPKL